MPSVFSWSLAPDSIAEPVPVNALTGGENAARDLLLDANDDLMLIGPDLGIARGGAGIAQSLKMRLRFFLGEWFADETVGIDFWNSVLVKNPEPNVLVNAFLTEIKNTLGIKDVLSMDFAYTARERSLTVSFQATTNLGLLTVQVGVS